MEEEVSLLASAVLVAEPAGGAVPEPEDLSILVLPKHVGELEEARAGVVDFGAAVPAAPEAPDVVPAVDRAGDAAVAVLVVGSEVSVRDEAKRVPIRISRRGRVSRRGRLRRASAPKRARARRRTRARPDRSADPDPRAEADGSDCETNRKQPPDGAILHRSSTGCKRSARCGPQDSNLQGLSPNGT